MDAKSSHGLSARRAKKVIVLGIGSCWLHLTQKLQEIGQIWLKKLKAGNFIRNLKEKNGLEIKNQIFGCWPLFDPLHLGNGKSHLKIHALSPLGLLFLMCISD